MPRKKRSHETKQTKYIEHSNEVGARHLENIWTQTSRHIYVCRFHVHLVWSTCIGWLPTHICRNLYPTICVSSIGCEFVKLTQLKLQGKRWECIRGRFWSNGLLNASPHPIFIYWKWTPFRFEVPYFQSEWWLRLTGCAASCGLPTLLESPWRSMIIFFFFQIHSQCCQNRSSWYI